MFMAISIIRWVCHDPQLLGSLVNFDESSASISAAPNYWDSAREKRQREDGKGRGCVWVREGRKGGDKALVAFNDLDQSPHHLPASTICPGVCITMSASDKSQIPTHQQQIVIGIPFMSHHMPSYPLPQKRAPSGWMGGQNFLTSLSLWKELAPFWIHKG